MKTLIILLITLMSCKQAETSKMTAATVTEEDNDTSIVTPGVHTQLHTRHDSNIQPIVEWYEGIRILPNLTDNYPINYSTNNLDTLEESPTCKTYPDGTKDIIIHTNCNLSELRREMCVLRAINKCIEGYRSDRNLTTRTIPNPNVNHTTSIYVSFTNTNIDYDLMMFQYWCNRSRILVAHFYNDYSLLKQLNNTQGWNCNGTDSPTYPRDRSYYDGWSTNNY